jgi:hypothetical protein
MLLTPSPYVYCTVYTPTRTIKTREIKRQVSVL